MISCKNRNGIDYVIDFLNTDYSKVNVYRGHVSDYLCMLFDFSLSISMGNIVAEFLQELAVADDAHAESPAASHLYIIDNSEVMLDDKTSKHPHSSVVKVLYMATRGRPDILKAVSFLTTS